MMDRTDTTTTAQSATDLERGHSKDVDTLAAPAKNHLATQQLTASGQPATKGLYKYLLLGVFCLGVFIDGKPNLTIHRILPTGMLNTGSPRSMRLLPIACASRA